MIHVVATIRVKPGCMPKFLEIFKSNVQNVLAEAGCSEYRPTVDIPTGLPPQVLDPDSIILVEKWSSLDALRTHLVSPPHAGLPRKGKRFDGRDYHPGVAGCMTLW